HRLEGGGFDSRLKDQTVVDMALASDSNPSVEVSSSYLIRTPWLLSNSVTWIRISWRWVHTIPVALKWIKRRRWRRTRSRSRSRSITTRVAPGILAVKGWIDGMVIRSRWIRRLYTAVSGN